MSDIDKVLTYLREMIEYTASVDNGENEDFNHRENFRRIETMLMKQERMESEWDAIRDELKAMADKVQKVAERNKALEEALIGVMQFTTLLMDDPSRLDEVPAFITARKTLKGAQQDTAFVSAGVAAIAAERKRQIEQEGWTPEHDDEHVNISFEDTLAVMLSATQEVQNLLLWAGINGEVSRNQVRLLIREAKCIKRCAKALTQEVR